MVVFGLAWGCSTTGSDEPAGPDAAAATARAPVAVPPTAPADAVAVRAAHIAARQAEGARELRYHAVTGAGGVRTRGGRGLDAAIDGAGVALRTDLGLDGRLETAAVRCGGRALTAPRGEPAIDPTAANRVVRGEDPGSLEWYVNGPLGLEHGFELAAGCATTLTVELATPGLVAEPLGDDVRLVSEDGALALRYAHLYAHDAGGRALPARFLVGDERLAIEVDVSAASGVVTIDPLVYVEVQRMGPPPDGDDPAGDQFGVSVSMSGTTAIVGARGDDVAGNVDQGAAYVYARSGHVWSLEARLVAPDGAAGDGFGSDVAVQGDTAVVSAPGDDVGANVDQGSAYVFVRAGDGWIVQGRLLASDGAAGDGFGNAVALAGNTALVGARADDVAGKLDQGSAYFFARSGSTWSLVQRVSLADGAAGDELGGAVALTVDTAVLGAPGDDVAQVDQGSAAVYVRSGSSWAQQARLVASDGAPGDRFGGAVAAFENTALVGAPLDDGAFVDQGAAYVYVRTLTSWQQRQRLIAGDAAAGDRFGARVALVTDLALVGAVVDDLATGIDQGSAYAFVRGTNGFVPDVKLVASDGAAGDHFGQSVVAIAQLGQVYYTAVGAPLADGPAGAVDVGAVYFGHLEPPGTCSGQPDGTICRLSAGPCDVAERCDGVSSLCPADDMAPAGTACGDGGDSICDHPDTCDGAGACVPNFEAATTTCRPDAGDCDVAETCDGAGACPADSHEPAGTTCGDGSDSICDHPDTCNGLGLCEVNREPPTTICRADTGECDVAETCNGAGDCPADGFEPPGTACGDGSESTCDHADSCDGGGACVPNVEPTTTICRADAGECDVAETCDGAGGCPADGFESPGTACGDGSESTCDHPDSCDGGGACQSNVEPSTTVCRPELGVCDVAETCDGAGACPADGFLPAGTACDPAGETCVASEETCTGASAACPDDDPRACDTLVFVSVPSPVLVDECAITVDVPADQLPVAVNGLGMTVPVTCEPVSGPGVHLVECIADDGAGHTASVTMTVTVVAALRIAFRSPLGDDNVRDDIATDADVANRFKSGSTVPHKVKLFSCAGEDVTAAHSTLVTVTLGVTVRSEITNALVVDVPEVYSGTGGPGGAMIPMGDTFQYNLRTTGYEEGTLGNAHYFQSLVTVVYNVYPTLVVGAEDAALESK